MNNQPQSAGQLPSWAAPTALVVILLMGAYMLLAPSADAEEYLPPGVTSEQAAIEQITAASGVATVETASHSDSPILHVTKGLPVQGILLEAGAEVPLAADGEAVVVVPPDTHPSVIAELVQAAQDWGYSVKVYLQHAWDGDSVAEVDEPAAATEPAG